MKLILCVEDEINILENNRKALEDAGYRVITAETVAQAKEHLSRETPDAIVLDIMLPDGNGLDFLCELRTAGSNIPIIMLTAWGKSSDIARGLKAGANDYLSKPFTYEVLLARIEAMFRNVEQMPERVTRGSLDLDLFSGQAYLNGEDMMLTQKEFALLFLLVQNEGKNLSAEYIYEKVWKQSMNEDDRAVRFQISQLRAKLYNSGYILTNTRGKGYCLEKE